MSSLPWSLASGDIETKLSSLRTAVQPSEEVSSRIWSLVGRGFPLAQLSQALRLVQDIPMGTAQVEQQHASATLMRKVPSGDRPEHAHDEELLPHT